jgi:hypothetical protein
MLTRLLILLALSAQAFVAPHNSRKLLAIFAEETDYAESPESPESPEAGNDSNAEIIDDVDTAIVEAVEEFSDTMDEMKSRSIPVEETIIKLIQIGASTGRGEFANQYQQDQASELISTLELKNPTPEPTKSPLMKGRWELLYSSTQLFRSSPFFMAGRAVCSTPEQAKQYDWFCDMHRKSLAISTIGQVRQIVSNTRLVSEFEVNVGAVPFLSDFAPFRYSGGLPVSIPTETKPRVR